MNALKMFTFHVENSVTKEITSFIGQGTTLEEAWKDGIATITGKFRPDSNGGGEILPLNVRLPSGTRVNRMKIDFEGEEAFEEDAPVSP